MSLLICDTEKSLDELETTGEEAGAKSVILRVHNQLLQYTHHQMTLKSYF